MNFRQKLRELTTLFIVNVVYSVIYLACCYDAEHWKGMDDGENHSFGDKLFNRLYFSIVTFSTVGYGDITPVSRTARSLVMIQILFNINSIVRLALGK